MNSYEEKLEARKEKYLFRATRAAQHCNVLASRARSMADAIPFGQPILVGHHSEGRDRRYRAKIGKTMSQAVAADDKAEYYLRKAESVGKGGISSDDPEAVAKLKEKLAALEKNQALMIEGNKIIKKAKDHETRKAGLVALGLSEKNADEVLNPRFGIGFARFELSNNRANITRIKERIALLEQKATRKDCEIIGNGYTYKEDAEDNRLGFTFDGKPAEEIRTLLKRNGFKWSPTRGAWVRQLNNNGIYAAKQVRLALDNSSAV